MQGLILAAGRGSRLGDYGRGTPKCLLEVGRRRLIEHQLEAFAEAGVAPVAIVVGYCADEVREVVGIRAEYIVNPRWESTNSMYSFWLAREWIRGPVVVANCDVLFHPKILERVLAAKGDGFAYDSGNPATPEHMSVQLDDDGCLVDMSKELSAEAAAGENVGLLHFTAETARAIADEAGRLIDAGKHTTWLAAAVRNVAQARRVRGVDIAGLPWGEIDSAYDLAHVRRSVWPAIHKRAVRATARLAAATALVLGTGGTLAYTRAGAAAPVPEDWDSVDVSTLPRADVTLRDRRQGWSRLAAGQTVEVPMEGAGPVRIESRLVLPRERSAALPYAVRVTVDGEVVDIDRKEAALDPDARSNGGAVGDRKRTRLELEPGRHVVAVTLFGGTDHDECLIRIRRPSGDVEE